MAPTVLVLLFLGFPPIPKFLHHHKTVYVSTITDARMEQPHGYHIVHPPNTGATPDSQKDSERDLQERRQRNRDEMSDQRPPTYSPQVQPQGPVALPPDQF